MQTKQNQEAMNHAMHSKCRLRDRGRLSHGRGRTEVEHYGDYLVQMKVSSQARKKNPALPEYWQVRAVTHETEGKEKTVFTSPPAAKFNAEQVARFTTSEG